MSQVDYNIENGTGAVVRAELNQTLQAIVTNNSGLTAPLVTFPFMFWADTTAGLLKVRNAENDNWVTIGALANLSRSSIYTNNIETMYINTTGQVFFTLTGSIKIPSGTTGERPAAAGGLIRYNTTLDSFEVAVGSTWQHILTTKDMDGSILITPAKTDTMMVSRGGVIGQAEVGEILKLQSSSKGGSTTRENLTALLNLSVDDTLVQNISFSTSNLPVILPSALTLELGVNFIITNTGTIPFWLKDYSGNYITFVECGDIVELILTDKSSSTGMWKLLDFKGKIIASLNEYTCSYDDSLTMNISNNMTGYDITLTPIKNNKLFLTYFKTTLTSDYTTYCRVMTVNNDGTITLGAENTLYVSNATYYYYNSGYQPILRISDTNLVYLRVNNSGKLAGGVITIGSDDSISIGTEAYTSSISPYGYYKITAMLHSSTLGICAYSYAYNGQFYYMTAFSISGTTLTFGAAVAILRATNGNAEINFEFSSQTKGIVRVLDPIYSSGSYYNKRPYTITGISIAFDTYGSESVTTYRRVNSIPLDATHGIVCYIANNTLCISVSTGNDSNGNYITIANKFIAVDGRSATINAISLLSNGNYLITTGYLEIEAKITSSSIQIIRKYVRDNLLYPTNAVVKGSNIRIGAIPNTSFTALLVYKDRLLGANFV